MQYPFKGSFSLIFFVLTKYYSVGENPVSRTMGKLNTGYLKSGIVETVNDPFMRKVNRLSRHNYRL